jgi:predicted nuclease with TOPRIM domain
VNVHEFHSEELREEVARLVAESARLREEAKSNEQQMRAIAARLAGIEREMETSPVGSAVPGEGCFEWQPGS